MIGKEQFQYQLSLLLHDFRQHTYLLAVSGGADSMVLLWLFDALGLTFEVAHINYRLRGEDSEADRHLVENYCTERNIPIHIYNVTEKDHRPEGSIQLWARQLRYRFFADVQAERSLELLATAHHLNDQLETFIINLSRGSGLKGLAGMPADRNRIVRPLLHFSKQDIYSFAAKHQIPFREDYTNAKTDYLRNRIRHCIVPELATTSPDFLSNFERSIGYLQDARDYIRRQSREILRQISVENQDGIIILREALGRQPRIIRHEILSAFGMQHEEEITKLFSAGTGSRFFTENYSLTVNRNEIIVTPLTCISVEDEEYILLKNLEEARDRNFEIHIPDTLLNGYPAAEYWYFDVRKLMFPLKIRHRKPGDLFFPTGMDGRKKVSKFFKDKKISILAKPKIWLLCDGEDHILGIIPWRQDRRYACTKGNGNALTVRMV